MDKYNFLQPHLWFKKQKYSLENLILFSVITIFSLLQTAKTITSENSHQRVILGLPNS